MSLAYCSAVQNNQELYNIQYLTESLKNYEREYLSLGEVLDAIQNEVNKVSSLDYDCCFKTEDALELLSGSDFTTCFEGAIQRIENFDRDEDVIFRDIAILLAGSKLIGIKNNTDYIFEPGVYHSLVRLLDKKTDKMTKSILYFFSYHLWDVRCAFYKVSGCEEIKQVLQKLLSEAASSFMYYERKNACLSLLSEILILQVPTGCDKVEELFWEIEKGLPADQEHWYQLLFMLTPFSKNIRDYLLNNIKTLTPESLDSKYYLMASYGIFHLGIITGEFVASNEVLTLLERRIFNLSQQVINVPDYIDVDYVKYVLDFCNGYAVGKGKKIDSNVICEIAFNAIEKALDKTKSYNISSVLDLIEKINTQDSFARLEKFSFLLSKITFDRIDTKYSNSYFKCQEEAVKIKEMLKRFSNECKNFQSIQNIQIDKERVVTLSLLLQKCTQRLNEIVELEGKAT
jgi:two-component sensor histidine kinase